MIDLKQKLKKKEIVALSFAIMFFLVIVPLITSAGSSKKIYVDDDAKGTQNGSSAHPYKTISQAIKKSNKNTLIFIRKGTYEENIEIPEGVEIQGADKDNVIIEADNNNLTTVKMKNKTKLMNLTVKGGKEGVKIKEGDKALIYKCIIKKARDNGIFIEEGNQKKNEEVSIIKSEIKDNHRTGIFSRGRKVVIQESQIIGNRSDGIDLGGSSRAWIEDNTLKNNYGSGLKIELDQSEIYTKSNHISGNRREGVEINLESKSGKVVLKKDKIKNNGNYGVSRVQRSAYAGALWSGATIESNVEFLGNGLGSVSHIFRIY